MGALLARHEGGVVAPLSITKAHVHMDEPKLDLALKESKRLLARAIKVGEEFDVKIEPLTRIDDDIAHGISRAAREVNATLVVMGWSSTTSIQARLFGSVVDSVFWSSHCPVAMMRLRDEPVNIHRILVPVKNLTPQSLLPVRFAQLFADINQAEVTLLWVRDRKNTKDDIYHFRSELKYFLSQSQSEIQVKIKTIRSDDVAEGIIQIAKNYDLVLLRSMRRRTVGGLAVSDVATKVLCELKTSVVLFGEPYRI
jgi:nucleotide-binding universal stress UspA family protein